MRLRSVALFTAAFSLAGAVAHADISLTEQQAFARGAARAEYGASGPTPVSLALVSPRLVDASGLEWFVNAEVPYALGALEASSAAGAASDAVFVSAVAATTAGGGTHLAVLADAFDGYNGLLVSVDGGASVAYNQAGAASTDCDGRQVVMPALSFSGVSVQRKVYVPATDSFARWLNIVTNGGPTARQVTLTVTSDLGSDAKTRIGTTSSGDTTASTADDWVTTYEDFTQGASPDPRLAHVFANGVGSVRPSTVSVTNGSDKAAWAYTFTVPAGGTVVVMNLASGQPSRSAAAAKAAQLAARPAATVACMSAAETSALVNFGDPGAPPPPPPPPPVPTVQIDTPTAAPAFAASGPYVGIGGTAGSAGGITTVTWATDRGFSGTAFGTTSWSVHSLPLAQGTNLVTVTARDGNGQTATDTLTVTLGELSYHMAEGATSAFFKTDISIANPNATSTTARVTFLKRDGTVVTLPQQTLPAQSYTQVAVNGLQGLENAEFSTVVVSPTGAPLVVGRSMFWNDTYYGSHAASATEGPRTRWYFGEGSEGSFTTYVLLANANATDAAVTVRYLPDNGAAFSRDYTVKANSRENVWVGEVPELVGKSFAMVVESALPITAERAMYFGTPVFNGGHDSPGQALPSTQWLFAEGASGAFFDAYFLVGNPGLTTANLVFTYQLATGGTVVVNRSVAAGARLTVLAELEDPQLADTAFSLKITSDQPVVAERSMYWGGGPAQWFEAHNSFGVQEPATRWGIAEGRVGTARQFETWVLVGNPTASASRVRVTFMRAGGGTVVKEYDVAANTRFNLHVNSLVPELRDESFGALVEVVSGSPVVVETSVYNSANGLRFAAGTNAIAVRLP